MITEGMINDILRTRNPKWRTSITRVEPNRIVTKGLFSGGALIGGVFFSEMVYLLIRSELPSENVARMLEVIQVSFCDHGVYSSQYSGCAYDCFCRFLRCMPVSPGLLVFGKNHAGAIKAFHEALPGHHPQMQLWR